VDIKFLHGCSRPTIAVLYEDSREARHVKTYVINGEWACWYKITRNPHILYLNIL
jgi:hypothetical protein